MDDCSPDHTPEVAATLTDPRVRYIRNEQNLGHLRNYKATGNKLSVRGWAAYRYNKHTLSRPIRH